MNFIESIKNNPIPIMQQFVPYMYNINTPSPHTKKKKKKKTTPKKSVKKICISMKYIKFKYKSLVTVSIKNQMQKKLYWHVKSNKENTSGSAH